MLYLVFEKFEEKYQKNEIERKSRKKIKNKFKINKLFLYVTLNYFFSVFNSFIIKMK